MTFLSAFVLLVLVMDGLGDIPLYLSALRPVPRKRWWRVILRGLDPFYGTCPTEKTEGR